MVERSLNGLPLDSIQEQINNREPSARNRNSNIYKSQIISKRSDQNNSYTMDNTRDDDSMESKKSFDPK